MIAMREFRHTHTWTPNTHLDTTHTCFSLAVSSTTLQFVRIPGNLDLERKFELKIESNNCLSHNCRCVTRVRRVPSRSPHFALETEARGRVWRGDRELSSCTGTHPLDQTFSEVHGYGEQTFKPSVQGQINKSVCQI